MEEINKLRTNVIIERHPRQPLLRPHPSYTRLGDHMSSEHIRDPEQETLLPGEEIDEETWARLPRHRRWQHHTGEALESKRVHRIIIGLVSEVLYQGALSG